MSKAVEEARKEVDKARAELAERQAALNRIENLASIYPDLGRYEGRWKRVVYRSALVNAEVTDVFFRYNCGCCGDSPLEVWPFLKTEHGEVYSTPACFSVGEKHWISGARPNAKWETELRAAGLPDVVIERVRARFERDRLERIEIASEESTTADGPD